MTHENILTFSIHEWIFCQAELHNDSKMRKIFGCTGNMCNMTKDIFCHITTGEELFFHESFVQYHLWENLIATEILVDRENISHNHRVSWSCVDKDSCHV